MTDGILEFVEDILEVSFGFDIDAIWYNLEGRCNNLSYREKIEAFCYILKVAMDKGILKIANESVFLEGTSQEISDIFKSSFPASEDKMSDDMFCFDIDDNFWTPGGGVWICNDGDEIWT
ncbi:DUF596 domain-containing protein [Zymobacter sp. IVIA_5232.4 C2]|uniref:DUF596 domain-containing protein n=1 Tax=Zymobacter sp. IVIA_5232.4 C2 TaxID=3394855 RepID=UPI0039C27D87